MTNELALLTVLAPVSLMGQACRMLMGRAIRPDRRKYFEESPPGVLRNFSALPTNLGNRPNENAR
jgi:hypothetical protein